MATAESFAKRLELKIVSEKEHIRGAVRSTGFAAAKGGVLLSTEILALAGPMIVRDCTMLRNNMLTCGIEMFFLVNKLRFGDMGLCGANFAIRREAYLAAGGFKRIVDVYEDMDLASAVRAHGPIGFDRKFTVSFSGRRFHGGIARGWYDYLHTFGEKYFRKNHTVKLRDVR